VEGEHEGLAAFGLVAGSGAWLWAGEREGGGRARGGENERGNEEANGRRRNKKKGVYVC